MSAAAPAAARLLCSAALALAPACVSADAERAMQDIGPTRERLAATERELTAAQAENLRLAAAVAFEKRAKEAADAAASLAAAARAAADLARHRERDRALRAFLAMANERADCWRLQLSGGVAAVVACDLSRIIGASGLRLERIAEATWSAVATVADGEDATQFYVELAHVPAAAAAVDRLAAFRIAIRRGLRSDSEQSVVDLVVDAVDDVGLRGSIPSATAAGARITFTLTPERSSK